MPAPPEPAALTDADLAHRIAAAAAGQARAAEEELCRRFARRVRLYGLRHLRRDDLAEDLVQVTLELIIVKLRNGEVREPERIASFVLGCARMQAHAMRRRVRREVPADSDAIAGVAADPPPEPWPHATERLSGCLEALRERERSVVVLSFFGEESAAAIGKALAISAGNVRVIRHRAVDRLRKCMGIAGDES